MSSIIYKNEQTKRRFYEYLKNSRQFSDKTVDCYEGAIWLWEDFTHHADFADCNSATVGAFKDFLKNKKKTHSEETVGLSYCYDMLRFLKLFFEWLSQQKGYKLKINQEIIDGFNLTKKENRIATQPKEVQCPEPEDVKKVLESIKSETEVELRDRALISLTFLTGARIEAIMTLPMQSFDRENTVLYQDPGAMKVSTKFSKRIVTALIPLSYKEPLTYFLQWFDYLKDQKGFGATDPIFPASKVENGTENISYQPASEVDIKFWRSSSSPREVFKKRFEEAGVPYFHPHTFRHLLVKTISKLPLTEEQKKAISQNFGHEDVGTTFGSYGYGKISEARQIELVKNLNFEDKNEGDKYSNNLEEIKVLLKKVIENKDH